MEIGVLDDFTITSATSDIGIAFRLPRGGVGKVLGPGDGAENILRNSQSFHCQLSLFPIDHEVRDGI